MRKYVPHPRSTGLSHGTLPGRFFVREVKIGREPRHEGVLPHDRGGKRVESANPRAAEPTERHACAASDLGLMDELDAGVDTGTIEVFSVGRTRIQSLLLVQLGDDVGLPEVQAPDRNALGGSRRDGSDDGRQWSGPGLHPGPSPDTR